MAGAQDEPSTGQRTRVRTIIEGRIASEADRLDVGALRAGGDASVAWIHLVDPSERTLRSLQETYGLHPLILGELTGRRRGSGASVFDHATHVVLRFPLMRHDTIVAGEIHVIIGERFFVTIHQPGVLVVDDALGAWRATPPEWRATTGALLYAVLHAVVAAYGPVVDQLDASLQRLERDAITPPAMHIPRRQLLYALFQVSEQIIEVGNMAGPAQDVMHSLAQNTKWLAHKGGKAYTRNVLDDAAHVSDRLSTMGDTAGRLFDMVNSLITLRSTDVANRLTIVATIFLPLSFLSSYFGQNFAFMTSAVSHGAQFVLWGLIVPLLSLLVSLLLLRRVGAFG